MSIMKSKAVLAYIEKRKAMLVAEATKPQPVSKPKPQPVSKPKPKPVPKRRELTPKDKARYAVQQRGGDLWMQQWIDWDDKSIPVGKRRVAFVRYLTMTKGFSLESAKYRAKLYIK